MADTQIEQLSDAQRRDFRINNIGFVFQDFELIEYLNVMDNIIHPYRITRSLQLTPSVRQRAIQLAEKIGIGDKLKRYANDLSQGEKQRVAICRALLPGPKLVFADEATGNLDPRNKGRILDLLFDNVAEHGTTLLAVTHDHELLPRFDRVVDFLQFREPEPLDARAVPGLAIPCFQQVQIADHGGLCHADCGVTPVTGSVAR